MPRRWLHRRSQTADVIPQRLHRQQLVLNRHRTKWKYGRHDAFRLYQVRAWPVFFSVASRCSLWNRGLSLVSLSTKAKVQTPAFRPPPFLETPSFARRDNVTPSRPKTTPARPWSAAMNSPRGFGSALRRMLGNFLLGQPANAKGKTAFFSLPGAALMLWA